MADTPPSATSRIRPPRDKAKAKKDPPKLNKGELQERMAEQLTVVGMMVGSGDAVGGFIILTNADMFAQSWAEVAEVNPRVKRILEGWFSTSVYANAAAATAAIALPLATHWRVLPRSWFNPASGSVDQMETLVKEQGLGLSDLMRMHAEAQEQARQAREVFQEAMQNMNGHGAGDGDDPDHYEAPAEGSVK